MEKKKSKNKSILKILASIVLVFFCSCFLVGCVGSMSGGSGGTGGSGGSTGGSSGSDEKPKNPYEGGAATTINNYNDLFMGAIGVYEVDSSAEVFYDNYTGNVVNFDFLVERQFKTLATVIYDSLNYVYGSAGAFVGGNLSDYGSSTISFAGIKDELIGNVTIYRGNVNSTKSPANIEPKYTSAMNGYYPLIRTEVDTGVQQTDAEGNPMTDAEGNPINIIEIHFNYDTNFYSLPWVRPLTSFNDLVGPLKDLYKAHVNADLKTIGFTELYKQKVLEYINNNVIGSSCLNTSNNAQGYVFNGTSLKSVDDSNYQEFSKYKAYELIVPSIIDNAFKLVKDGSNVKISSNYSFSDGIPDWKNTLFPNLGRFEYVFYDDINDVCDAEGNEYPDNFDTDSFVPNPDYQPDNFDPDYDFEEGAPESSAVYKVGSLRKIKEIILLPKLTAAGKVATGGDTFNLTGVNIAWARPSGSSECRVKITTDVKDNNGKSHENVQVKLDDGTFSIDLPGMDTPMVGGTRVDFVTSEGYIIVDELESGGKAEGEANKIGADVFSSKSDRESFKFGDLELTEAEIKESFTSNTYTVSSTNEEIGAWKLNVCNNLVLLDFDNIYKINFTKNIVRFKFDYLNSGNAPIDIPELYLMDFTFMS